MKALSIIGIFFTIIFLFWFILAATSNGRIDIEEFAPVGIFYGLYMLIFSIIATVSSFKKKKI